MENDDLEKELRSTTSDILTNDRKTFYEDQGIDNLNFYYSFVRIIYIIIAIGFTVSMFMFPSQLTLFKKIGIIVLLALYPFISTKVLSWVIQLYYAIINVLPKNMHRSL